MHGSPHVDARPAPDAASAPKHAGPGRAGPAPEGLPENLDDAIARILAAARDDIAGAAGRTPGTPEAVHTFRVALRRLRAALSPIRRAVPAPEFDRLADDARALAHRLGRARSWDVFTRQTFSGQRAGADSATIALHEAARRHRAAAAAGLRERLEAGAATRLVDELDRLVADRSWRTGAAPDVLARLDAPAGDLARAAASRLAGRILKRGKGFRHLSSEQRHELRLACKKLRYVIEVFAPPARSASARLAYLTALGDLLDALGAANDAVAAEGLLAELGGDDASREAHPALEKAGRHHRRRLEKALKRARRAWHAFRHAPVFWAQ